MSAPARVAPALARSIERARAIFRLAAIVAVTAVMWSGMVAGIAALRLARRSAARWKIGCFRAWSGVLLRVLAVRLSVEGSAPSPPFLLVSNHLSYLDILVLGSRAPMVFVSRADVAGWPVLGRLARQVGTLFVDRERRRDIPRVVEAMQARLAEQLGVTLFPEATSSDGSDVLPFRAPLLEPAARSGLPVWYASLSYATPTGSPPARLAVCWWADMTFPGHVFGLLRLPRVSARVTFGLNPVASDDRKVLAEALWQAIRQQHRPVTG